MGAAIIVAADPGPQAVVALAENLAALHNDGSVLVVDIRLLRLLRGNRQVLLNTTHDALFPSLLAVLRLFLFTVIE